MSKYISVCISTSDMKGRGAEFLRNNLDILAKQDFKDFEVVVSDNSLTDDFKNICEQNLHRLSVVYVRNPDPEHRMATNINNAIRHASGKLIKILFLDDFLRSEKSLQQIVDNFDLEKDRWLVTACEHTVDGKTFMDPHYPRYNDDVHLGKNRIGSPSVLTIKNQSPLFFDDNLAWFIDCDYYKRMHIFFGPPKILNEVNVVIRTGDHQATNSIATTEFRKKEYLYMREKFWDVGRKKVKLPRVTVAAVTGLDPTSAVRAIELSMQGVEYYEALLIAHKKPANLNPKITFRQCQPTDLVNQDKRNTDDWSKFIAYEFYKYIYSDFVIIVHNDAYVLRPNKWKDEFMDYDYLGAPWPPNLHFTKEGINVRIGNGGFSMRSRKILKALTDYNLPFTEGGTGFYNEDGIFCVYYRKELEDRGIKFATIPIASAFSHERTWTDSVWEPFGFHNNKRVIPRFYFFKFNLDQYYKKAYMYFQRLKMKFK